MGEVLIKVLINFKILSQRLRIINSKSQNRNSQFISFSVSTNTQKK